MKGNPFKMKGGEALNLEKETLNLRPSRFGMQGGRGGEGRGGPLQKRVQERSLGEIKSSFGGWGRESGVGR